MLTCPPFGCFFDLALLAPATAALAEQLGLVLFDITFKDRNRTVLDQPEPVSHRLHQMRVVADNDNSAWEIIERMNQRLTTFNIEVVCRLIKDQDMRGVNGRHSHQQPRFLAA